MHNEAMHSFAMPGETIRGPNLPGANLRVLFLSNLYPPAGNGGYEQWCQEVADGLAQRGHAVRVLTSQVEAQLGPDTELQVENPAIFRQLYMEMTFATRLHSLHFFTRRQRRERHNLELLRQHVDEFQPDAIVIWGMWNLPRSLPALAEALLPERVVYYMGDYWPTLPSQHVAYWQAPAQNLATLVPKVLLRPLAKQVLARQVDPPLQLERVLFPSATLLEQFVQRGVRLHETRIIYGAIDTRPFLDEASQPARELEAHTATASQASSQAVLDPALTIHDTLAPDPGPLRLLYVGRLSPEKGLETAIDALQELVYRRFRQNLHLTIVGSGEQRFTAELQERARSAGLENFITFRGPVSKPEMPALYRQFDALLFTSTWQEPFGRVLVEALAAGLLVIASAAGGATEILEPGETALTYRPKDVKGLADQIDSVLIFPEQRQRLAQKGRQVAIAKFDMTRMVAEIERYLLKLVN